jgi:putative ABC transport system permease protein
MLLYKNAYLKIRHSLGRFLSLFLIIAIGVGFYAGIKEAIPQIRHVQNTYNKKYHLMDFKIVSTQGLTQKDIQALTSKDVKEIEGSYNVEALEKDHAIMIHAITTHINTSRLIKG